MSLMLHFKIEYLKIELYLFGDTYELSNGLLNAVFQF